MMRRPISLRFSIVFLALMFGVVYGTVLSAPGKSFAKTAMDSSQPRVSVDGFRSARFCMRESGVMRAIFKDFKIPKSKVTKITHPTEKTTSFGIDVSNLLPKTDA